MKKLGLSNNQLKILAMLAMTADHVGLQLFPQVGWLRIIGRLALPIFAYMIAEGCRHTRHPLRYLGMMVGFAALCQGVYFFALNSLYMCILVTFSLSISLILLIRLAEHKHNPLLWLLPLAALAGIYYTCRVLPSRLPGTDFEIDYGFWGVMLPVVIYAGRDNWGKLICAAFGLCLLAYTGGAAIQWYSLLALPLLALYNGQRGKWRMKWFFYFFYPAHLVIIYGISLLI